MKFGVDNPFKHKITKLLFSKYFLFSVLIFLLNISLINNNNDASIGSSFNNIRGKFEEEGINSMDKIRYVFDQLKKLNQVLPKDATFELIKKDLEILNENSENNVLPSNHMKSNNLEYLDDESANEEKIKFFNNAGKKEDKNYNGFNIIEKRDIFEVSRQTSKEISHNNEIVIIDRNSSLYEK